MEPYPSQRLSVAPMMELTDRHFRYLMRLISQRSLLFTEMVTARAVLHGDRGYLLGFNAAEHPLALQLGGSDANELSEASVIGEGLGFDEINLNVGCPSDRVQSGRFGACLMAEPQLVSELIAAMQARVALPVTVKCRVGIDRQDSYDLFREFIAEVASSGCKRFYVHARKAWLDGLSPKQNRDVPPLRYEFVYQLKQEFPDLEISINGGITEWSAIETHLQKVDGVMLGRAAYYNPALMFDADARVYADSSGANPPDLYSSGIAQPGLPEDDALLTAQIEVARQYAAYMDEEHSEGVPLSAMCRHLVGLIQQRPGARLWRRTLSSNVNQAPNAASLVETAIDLVVAHAQASASANNLVDNSVENNSVEKKISSEPLPSTTVMPRQSGSGCNVST